jgi:glycosyltransferase involved in cell wall biosynthesis
VQEDICNGCGYCISACPYGVIDQRKDDGRAWKCTLCYDRLGAGKTPACAQACPTESIQYGPLEELRERAAARVATLHERGVPEARLHLVGAGVDPASVTGGDGAAFRARHTISGPIVTILGTTAHDKGTPHVVEAMRALWRAGREATLVIAGPPMEHFVRFFEALPAADRARCRLLGFIEPQEKRDLLAATDLYAMPSRTDSFGIVYLEAWCCGIPVIGARAGGVPDVIDDGVDGLLVPFADVPALTDAIRTLLDDRALASAMGARGRAKTLERYTWDRVAAAFARIYDDVLGGQVPSAEGRAVVQSPPTEGTAGTMQTGGEPAG